MISDIFKDRIQRRVNGLTAMPLDAGHVFYEALFREEPALQALFGDDMEKQSEKLIDMVFLVVHFLDGMDALAPEIEALGERHLGYGIRPAHLAAAKAALLESLAATLESWCVEDEDAWDALLTRLMDMMLIGLARAAADAPLERA